MRRMVPQAVLVSVALSFAIPSIVLAEDPERTVVDVCPSNAEPREDLVSRLREFYNQTLKNWGLDHEGVLHEVFTTPGGKQWTILGTRPEGCSYEEVAGKSWANVAFDSKEYDGKILRHRGQGYDDILYEVFTTPGQEQWRIVARPPEGPSSVVAFGEYWESLLPLPQTSGSAK